MLEAAFSLAFLFQVFRIAMPYVMAAMGGIYSERSGVVNIALEGKLLAGAFCAALGGIVFDSAAKGILCGVVGGVVVAFVFGVAVVYFKSDQIVTGIAVNLMVAGLTRFFLKHHFGSTANSPPTPGFDQSIVLNPVFWIAIAIVCLSYVVINKTVYGVRLRAAGEEPEALRSVGVDVSKLQLKSVLIAGALAGLGGAFLTLDNQAFVAEMSGGRGYIALAAVIMGRWKPLWAGAACLVFAVAEALQFHMQTYDVGIPGEFVQTLPYVLTILLLAGVVGRSNAPKSLGKT